MPQWVQNSALAKSVFDERSQSRAEAAAECFQFLGSSATAAVPKLVQLANNPRRPAWPLPWAERQARLYAGETQGLCMVGGFLFGEQTLPSLYDLDGLDAEARRVAAWIRRRAAGAVTPRAAFIGRMHVGERVARLIGHDPRLPQALWGRRRGMAEMVEAFYRFEERVAPPAQIFLDEAI